MQKYIVEQLLSSLHARALLHAVIVEPFGSRPDFILLNIFMSVKTQKIFSYLSMVIEQVNTTNTLIRVKMQQLQCFIICPAQQPSNMGTRIVRQ